MKLSKVGQFRLIDIIKRKNPAKGKDVIAAIGDDAAVIKDKAKNSYILLTTDSLVEGTHFDLRYSTFYELGWKLLAVNLSDIAAMGGTPKYALVTLGLKKNMSLANIDDFYAGIKALANKHKVEIVGGDIVSSPKSLFFTMDLFGIAKKVIKRSGARPGDAIISIGSLGGSAAGLASLKKYGRKALKIMGSNVEAHLMPSPMIKEGRLASRFATSMIDNSDGLARCLIEICGASNVGARVYLNKIPVAKGSTIKNAFNGGEDYNLILTVPGNKAKAIKRGIMIGEITRARKIMLIDSSGKASVMKEKGFEHF